jgi:peptide-methionine (R)-S-oxide reductase
MSSDQKPSATFTPLTKSKQEWKAIVPPTSTFVCAACHFPLFKQEQKFDSGTGWPSFFDALPGTVATKRDFKMVWPRTEYHCARCGGHQGHVFEDGPDPTGLRYCNNGVALKFIADGDSMPELLK